MTEHSTNSKDMITEDRFKNFYKKSRNDRLQILKAAGLLDEDDFKMLNSGASLSFEIAEHLIENLIGCFSLPLGLALNYHIDGKDYVVPMAVEETSIIAAGSKTAKWVRSNGVITTKNLCKLSIGQIQLAKVRDFTNFKLIIDERKNEMIESVNKNVCLGLCHRGGGLRDIQIRNIQRTDGFDMVIIHLFVDTCDAMGANIINQICEFLKPNIEELTGEKVSMCILSNLSDANLTQAKIVIRDIDPDLGHAIEEASLFAQLDPYRAATNNKGVMNAIDGILIATGNDWRAVEAGVHAYAAMSGQYTSITQWHMDNRNLVGLIEAPIIVGIVGGLTQIHPLAKICLKILGVKRSTSLARICAAVGLVQNLAALNALVTEGIIRGHMKLHVANLSLASDATSEELPILKQKLAERLRDKNRVSGTDIKEILNELRQSR